VRIAKVGARILKRFDADVVARRADDDDRRRRAVGVCLDDEIGAVERKLAHFARAKRIG
jgi:hypothetical protein